MTIVDCININYHDDNHDDNHRLHQHYDNDNHRLHQCHLDDNHECRHSVPVAANTITRTLIDCININYQHRQNQTNFPIISYVVLENNDPKMAATTLSIIIAIVVIIVSVTLLHKPESLQSTPSL